VQSGVINSIFNAWSSPTFSNGTAYQASTDLLVLCTLRGNTSDGELIGYSDSSNPPTTIRAAAASDSTGTYDSCTIIFPVKRGDYWKILRAGGSGGTTTVNIMSIGN